MKFYSIIANNGSQTGTDDSGSQGGGGLANTWIMLALMFVIMYFLLIRPQSKQRKEQAARVASLEKGDKVITIGGLHGTVHHISKATVTVKLSEGVFVPFEKDAIRSVTKVGQGKKKGQQEETEEEENADDQE
tara:strand:+ start:170 stop:568 length:399 start_codon:yes stop_codon:yes gene_type:complete